jgi:hypothetical protein
LPALPIPTARPQQKLIDSENYLLVGAGVRPSKVQNVQQNQLDMAERKGFEPLIRL